MAIWTQIFGLISGDNGPLAKLIDRIPDPNARARAKEDFEKELMGIVASQDAQQNEVNKIEAASSSLFVAGWRPFIGWVCGVSLAWQYIVHPTAAWALVVFDAPVKTLPVLDGTQMTTILLGMLGLGGLRTFEKIKEVARTDLKEK